MKVAGIDQTASILRSVLPGYFCHAQPELENITAILRILPPHCLMARFKSANFVVGFQSHNKSVS